MHLHEAPQGHPVEDHLPLSRLPGTYPKGRACVEPGCITRLNIYNDGPWCLIHAQRHQAEVLEAEVLEDEARALGREEHRARVAAFSKAQAAKVAA